MAKLQELHTQISFIERTLALSYCKDTEAGCTQFSKLKYFPQTLHYH